MRAIWIAAALSLVQGQVRLEPDVEQLVREARTHRGGKSNPAVERLSRMGSTGVPGLVALLDEPRGVLLWDTLQACVHARDPRVLSALVRRFERIRDPQDQSTWLLAFGNHGNPGAWPTVRPFLKSPRSSLRLSAAYAAGRLGDPVALPVLKALVKDGDASVAWQAKTSITWIESTVRKYPGRLSDPKAWWRAASPAGEHRQ